MFLDCLKVILCFFFLKLINTLFYKTKSISEFKKQEVVVVIAISFLVLIPKEGKNTTGSDESSNTRIICPDFM